MISKEDLDYLNKLDALRVEARTLRDRGLEAIVAFDLNDDDQWDQRISENETVLFRRAKHLAWNLGQIEEYDCEHFEHLYFSSKKPKYRPRVNYPQWPVIDLPIFKVEHFVNTPSLCSKLKEGTDHVSAYVRSKFNLARKHLLEEYEPGKQPSSGLLHSLTKELDSILANPFLYDKVILDEVTLRPETKVMVDQFSRQAPLWRKNRMMLEDAYPQEIFKAQPREGPIFKVSHLVNAASFCSRVKQKSDQISQYLWTEVRSVTKELFEDYELGGLPTDQLLNSLVEDLNGVLPKHSLQEKVILAHVKLRPETKALVDQSSPGPSEDVASQGAGLLRVNRMLLEDTYHEEIRKLPPSLDLFNIRDEPAPVLFAANYLRTRLGNLRSCLDEGTLACYYRVIRELYNVHDTDWALGAARPGEQSGKPSVFVTTECTRAIGYFARLMENTSQFLNRMYETKQYIQHVKDARDSSDPNIPALHPDWCQSELKCCQASVKTTIEGSRDYVAILLPNLKEVTDLDRMIELVEDSVREFARGSEDSFSAVMEWTKALREGEYSSHAQLRRQESRKIGNVFLQQMPEPDLTETAHRIAHGALAGARVEFRKLDSKKLRASGSDLLAGASGVFAKLAEWLRTHLDPAKEYFEKVLHKCLSETARERNPKLVQDLAFSALSVGLITKKWSRHDCRQALEILCENLDENGQFPDGRPFAYTARGEGRVVINAQGIRAFAQLAQHVTAHPNPAVVARIPQIVGRMIRYFQSQSIEHDHGIAWRSLGSPAGERSSLWITAISVLALHRIILMLDAHINYGVKKHLNTKTAAQLRSEGVPYLHKLMCSDIGYGSLPPEGPGHNRVVLELEGMRAHLLGPNRANKALRAKEVLGDLPISSLILHGPPGTGKTTLVKSLAVTSNVDLVEVMSHDLYRPGTERVMEQASLVMDALKLLTSSVILFDEFEPILHARPQTPVRITEMLTGNMLPKLDALYKAAGQNGIAYMLATNYVERIDAAAIRVGRFDRMRYIYYPDPASRVCRLVSELRLLLTRLKSKNLAVPIPLGAELRLIKVVAVTGRCFINHLCRTGWFLTPSQIKTAPFETNSADAPVDTELLSARVDSQDEPANMEILSPETKEKLTPVWRFVIWGEPSDSIDWSRFGSAEKLGSKAKRSPESLNETEIEARIVKMVRELIDWPTSDSAEKEKGVSETTQRPDPTNKTDDDSILKIVRDWDDALLSSARNNRNFDWQQMINLVSKPIETGKPVDRRKGIEERAAPQNNKHSGVERRITPDRRAATSGSPQ